MKTFRDLEVGDELLIINDNTKQLFYARVTVTVHDPNFGIYYVKRS